RRPAGPPCRRCARGRLRLGQRHGAAAAPGAVRRLEVERPRPRRRTGRDRRVPPAEERLRLAALMLIDEATFEKEAREFLERAVPRRAPEELAWGEGSDSVAIFHETTAEEEAAEVAAARAWQRQRFEAGFGWITGPPEYGGRGLTLAHE